MVRDVSLNFQLSFLTPRIDWAEKQCPEWSEPVVFMLTHGSHESWRNQGDAGGHSDKRYDLHSRDEIDQDNVHGCTHDDLREVSDRRLKSRQALYFLETGLIDGVSADGSMAHNHTDKR